MRGLALVAAALAASGACGAAVTGPAPVVDVGGLQFQPGPQVIIADRVTMAVPRPLVAAGPGVWSVQVHGALAAVLRVDVMTPAPADGAEVWLRERVRVLTRSGIAGVVRAEAVELADLDGRLVELLETVGERRGAVLLLAVEDERRLVAVTIALPASLLVREGPVLRAALATVRLQ